jgi:Ni2+-binding GTPase involved in maturation of urease and hydrogenase
MVFKTKPLKDKYAFAVVDFDLACRSNPAKFLSQQPPKTKALVQSDVPCLHYHHLAKILPI